ncbi:MAG TPA: PDZ domain-containing protein [Thermoanaerobaculia bacterium]|nr:PDZ domain-containing protein [Thermoanaerobaculia bacterium]
MLALVLAAVISVPATVHENMIFIEARVNGGAPATFLVDTAASRSVVDPRLGVKAGSEAELDLGGLRVKVPKLGTMDLGFFAVTEDLKLDGVLGMDVFRQFAIELDFDAALVRFLPPGSEGAGEAIPIRIEKNQPYLKATLKMPGAKAIAREYLMDTGSGGSISDELFPGLGRADYLTIGTFRFDGANGIGGGRRIGGELLKRFNITADFSRNRMFLEPSRHFRDALLFDTSGLELENHERGLKVVEVQPRTPASEAGLAAGDIITAIDGSRTLGLTRVRLMFHQVRTHTLTVQRGEQELTIALKLRRLR